MSRDQDEKFMRLAFEAAKRGIDRGNSPFGACIVRDGKVIAAGHNIVWESTDITAHGEINTLREACRAAKTIDFTGATIYSTTEPCPMCYCAIHWARINRIVYGARIQDAADFGFNELHISNQKLKELGKTGVQLVPDFLRDEAVEQFRYWKSRGGKTY